jgi:hypothetical protein
MKKITIISIILIISSSVFLGCVGEEKPVPTPTPEATETVAPTAAPIIQIPTSLPTPVTTPRLFPVTYKVWIDSDRGFYQVRAVNGTTYIPLPSDFNILNFTISAGDKLEWINDDSYDFPITVVSNEGLWEERGANYLRWQDAQFEYTFNKTGTYTFSIKEYPRIQHQKIIVDH